MANKKARVGIYLRVSTTGQTVENQRLDLQRVAEQRGWQIVAEYVDQGVSGAKNREKRPQFNELLRDVGHGKLDIIAAWALDRIGRNGRDVVNVMADLPQQGVELYLHREQLDSSTAVGKMVLTIMAAVSEMELASIKERIHAGLRRARAQGKTLGRPTVSHAVEASIRDLRAKGWGKVKIAGQLGCGVSTVSRVIATT